MNLQSSVELITPEFAAASLKMNTRNRAISRNTLETYVRAIERGEWLLNGEAIIFDSNGFLTDGQHRLAAVVRAKRPIQALVVRGVSPEAFTTIDGGKRRSAGDVLGQMGVKYANTVASGARAILRIQSSKSTVNHVTNSLILEVSQAHPTLPEWARMFRAQRMHKFVPSSLTGVCTLAGERHGFSRVAVFMQQVSDGVGLEKGDAAYVLRQRYLERRGGEQVTADTSIIYNIKAMNAFLSNTPIKVLRAGAGEAFPELV